MIMHPMWVIVTSIYRLLSPYMGYRHRYVGYRRPYVGYWHPYMVIVSRLFKYLWFEIEQYDCL